MSLIRRHLVFFLILSSACVLRFLPLFQYQFTYDELSALDRTQFSHLAEVLEKGVKIDAHPALIQVLLFYLVKLAGYQAWLIRLPFLLMGLGVIVYSYLFSLRNFGKQAGLSSAIFFSYSFIFVFYAPIARPYVSGLFFCMALLYHFFEIIFLHKRNLLNYVLLAAFALLSALNHHISALFAFTLFSGGLLLEKREFLKPFLISGISAVVCYMPHFTITIYQLSVPGIGAESGGWLTKPGNYAFTDLLKVLLGTGNSYLVVLAGVVVAVFFNRKELFHDRRRITLLLLFLTNFAIVFFYSLWRSPIFQYSVMIFAGAAFVLFVSSFLKYDNHWISAIFLTALAATLLFKSYWQKDYLNQCVKTVFEYQFERTVHYKNLYGSSNVYPMFFDCDTLMQKIYFKKYNTGFELKQSNDKEISYGQRMLYPSDTGSQGLVSSLKIFAEFVRQLDCNFLILTSAPPIYTEIAKTYFPVILENTQTQGINLKVLSKKGAGASVADDQILFHASHSAENGMNFSGRLPLEVESSNEFPFSGKADYQRLIKKEGQVLMVKALMKVKEKTPDETLELVIACNEKESNATQAYSGRAGNDFILLPDSSITLMADYFAGTSHEDIRYSSIANCFVWNRGGHKFQLKGFEIKVIDYWPRKWNLWW